MILSDDAVLAEQRHLDAGQLAQSSSRAAGGDSVSTGTDVFEWCWANSTELPDYDRAVLLHHAFRARDFPDRSERDGISLGETDPYANGRLTTGGWLAIDARAHALWFPAYEAAKAVTR